jgi:hypothetical protein
LFTTIRIIPLIIRNSVEDNLMDKEQRLEKVENKENSADTKTIGRRVIQDITVALSLHYALSVQS